MPVDRARAAADNPHAVFDWNGRTNEADAAVACECRLRQWPIEMNISGVDPDEPRRLRTVRDMPERADAEDVTDLMQNDILHAPACFHAGEVCGIEPENSIQGHIRSAAASVTWARLAE